MVQRSNIFGSKIGRRSLLGAAGVGGAVAVAGAAGLRGGLVPTASAQDSVTLTIWTPGGSPLFCTMQDDLATAYTGVNANVKFEPVQCGVGAAGDFMQVLLGAIAAGNPPDATLLWQTPVALGARAGLIALDDMMAGSQYAKAENWPAGLLETCQYKGQTFGLPVTAGIYTMWYNEELFESKGIPSDRASFPKTWDELRALSKEFTVWDGDVLKSSGFMPWGVNYSITTDTFYVWSALNGGSVFDSANLKYTIDSEANVAMMQYALDWLDEEYHGDVNAVLNSGQAWGAYSDPTGPAAFQAGNLAAMMNGSWVMGDLYAEVEPVFTRWNLAPIQLVRAARPRPQAPTRTGWSFRKALPIPQRPSAISTISAAWASSNGSRRCPTFQRMRWPRKRIRRWWSTGAAKNSPPMSRRSTPSRRQS